MGHRPDHRHLPTSDRRLAHSCAAVMYARNREMRALMEAGEVIMSKCFALLGFLAVLLAGNLPGTAVAGWDGCYRSPCYYRSYYPRYYGGCGGCGYRSYVGCAGCGYGGYVGCGGCGGYGGCGYRGCGGCSGYGGCGSSGYAGYGWDSGYHG